VEVSVKILVVGGGVAGPVSAIALRRLGVEVTIVEAYEDPGGDVGSFLSLATNGLRGLAAIGCLDRVRARGFPVARQRMWSGSGRLLGDLPRGRLAADPMHSVTLMRAHLVGELRQAARDAGVEIITGERLVQATSLPGSVRARFASGTAMDAALLVGADGIWSTTRRVVDPGAPAPRYAGLYTVSGVSRGVETEDGAFNMVFARNGAFIHVREPGGDVWWQAQVDSATRPVRDGVDDAERLRRLGELYRAERFPSAIIRATVRLQAPTVNHVLDPVPTWHHRHVVLVGDAAHAVGAGQGASMAIESGLALADALDTQRSVPAALAHYETVRRPRVTRMLNTARSNRTVKKAGNVKRGVEALLMPIFFRYFYERATAWWYAPATAVPSSTPVDAAGVDFQSGGYANE
jgi:salicylate hydroxylase